MKLAVLIPTYGRKAIVHRLLSYLERQTRRPDLVIVSAPDESHVDQLASGVFDIAYAFGTKGSSAQRNQALEKALPVADVVVFFDDDFLPATDYLAEIDVAFTAHRDWSVVTGYVIADGISSDGLSFEDGLRLLEQDEARPKPPLGAHPQYSAYGCNMAVRSSHIGTLRFDERLPLYSWQEDVDFTGQFHDRGSVVQLDSARGVHLGIKSGRVSGVRFGYSQIINPVYLIRKGTMPMRTGLTLMAKNIAANIVKSLRPEAYVDRRGRLRGNLIATYHLMLGRVEPEYVLQLKA